MTIPTSPKSEQALIRAIAQDRANYQAARALGAEADIFAPDGPHGQQWQAIAALYDRGVDPMPELLDFDTSGFFDSEPASAEQTEELALRAIGTHTRRQLWLAGNSLKVRSERESAGQIIVDHRGTLSTIEQRYARAKNPVVGNPADTLAEMGTWSTSTGVAVIDQVWRPFSGDNHIIAAPPGVGKTTLAIAIAGGTSSHGVPTTVITGETPAIEIQLGLLSQLKDKALDANFANDMRYNPTARTPANIDKVRAAWDQHFVNAPLRIHQVSDGPDEVISIISSLTGPNIILIDHLFAIVGQIDNSREPDHKHFYRLLLNIQQESQRGNHIPISFNQYTKGAIEAYLKRGELPDETSEYGGTGIIAVAATMWHLRRPRNAPAQSNDGHQFILGQVVKCRARLVCDQNGNYIDPLGQQQEFYINDKYRSVQLEPDTRPLAF